MPRGMSGHVGSVFKHCCISVPVDPLSKLPLAEFERTGMTRGTKKKQKKKYSVDSSSTESTLRGDNGVVEVSKFYNSIPNYRDLTHLSNREFYSTMKHLKEMRRQVLGTPVEVVKADDNIKRNFIDKVNKSDLQVNNWYIDDMRDRAKMRHILGYPAKCIESTRRDSPVDNGLVDATEKTWERDGDNYTKARKSRYISEVKCNHDADSEKDRRKNIFSYDTKFKKITDDIDTILNNDITLANNADNEKSPENCDLLSVANKTRISSTTKSKRNNSACSISWDDNVVVNNCGDDEDSNFKNFPSSTPSPSNLRKCRSLPSSPTKVKRATFPECKTTIPKPFKMTMRDEDHRKVQNLKCLTKSFSEEMLDRKVERKRFKANPVPIESRIPLYDKIVEDQELRRAIAKINSAMDLQAQMMPFSFTERDDARNSQPCLRSKQSSASNDATKKKKKFRAQPIPKNLFSNYIYDKMREDDFYRALNRRIRAEELLRSASVPPNMLARGRAAGGRARRRTRPETRIHDGQFITTCPQPFHFDTAARARRKETLKNIYKDRSAPALADFDNTRPLSALEIPSVNRSNLAAILRIETAKKKLEEDMQRKLAEEEFQIEMRWRDHILRKRPAWLSIKNTQEEDLAMRLQARRDEERLRREEFLHEMELMYGRVQQQPLLFERHYQPPPRHRNSCSSQSSDLGRLSPTKRQTRKHKSQNSLGPSSSTSRKVSINETAEMINEDIFNYLDINDEDEKTLYESDVGPYSVGELDEKKLE